MATEPLWTWWGTSFLHIALKNSTSHRISEGPPAQLSRVLAEFRMPAGEGRRSPEQEPVTRGKCVKEGGQRWHNSAYN